MRKDKKQKIMAIVVLCISVLGLTLGFAAFSNTLTISSSATVTPDQKDFKIKLYGLPQAYEKKNFDDKSSEIIDLFTSSTSAAPIIDTIEMLYPATADIAVIDNDNLSLKGMTAKFTGPDHYIDYLFLMRNEGEYDTYYNIMTYQEPSHTCEAGEGTTESLVSAACQAMEFSFSAGFLDESTSKIDWDISKRMDATGNVKLAKGEFLLGRVRLNYKAGTERPDGPMSVKWNDLNLTFSTTAQ